MFFTGPLFVGCDHAGFELKNRLIEAFPDLPWKDMGTHAESSVDYPDFAAKVCEAMKTDANAAGLLICGSGQGMAIKANRYSHIRAGLCWSKDVAHLARAHNNINILCLGSRVMTFEDCKKILEIYLNTPFEGGRHANRIGKI